MQKNIGNTKVLGVTSVTPRTLIKPMECNDFWVATFKNAALDMGLQPSPHRGALVQESEHHPDDALHAIHHDA